MRRFLYLLTFVLIVSLVQTVEARKLALLVGVDEYVNAPSLKCCVSDMNALKEALMKIGFEEDDIQILVTGGAYKNFPTKKNIEKYISQIVINAQPSDMVFLAFSGHGAQDGKNVYFCPPDVETEDLKGTCVSINKVMDILANKCKAKFKWMVVDACRNDPTRGAKGIGGKGLQVIPTPPAGIALFQSCAEGEESWEDRESGNGYFTKNFVAALSGEADSDRDGKLTLLEVCKWTTAHTKEQVKNNLDKSQRPYFSGTVSDFTLTEDLNVPKARAFIEEARKAIEEEKYDLAIQKFDEAIALCPQYSYIKRERATAQRLLNAENRVKIEQKQREEAEKKIKEERKPKEGNEHDWSAPIADFEDVEPDNEEYNVPDNPVSPENVPEIQEGLKALKNNDVEGALAKFEEARKSHPEFSPAELMLAKLALQINSKTNGPAARMLIERCIKNYPEDPEAYIFLGDYNLGNGSITEAEVLFRKAGSVLKNFHGNAQRKSAMIRQFNAGTAKVLERRGHFEQAKSYMESYLENDPKNVDAMKQLANIYLNMDNDEDAILLLTKAKKIDKSVLTPEAIVAMFYQEKGEKLIAGAYMAKALEKAPRDFNTRLAAARWSQMINNLKLAVAQTDVALQIDPKSEDAMLLRGDLALSQKDYAKAIEMYNKILTNSPDNHAAANNIALALCETGNKYDLKLAVEYAGVNAQKYGRQPEVFSTLGYVLLKNGEVNDSLKALQQSLLLTNGQMSPDTAYYLCAALVAKGTDEGVKQAKDVLTKTLDATPTFNMRPEAEKLLEELNKRDRWGY